MAGWESCEAPGFAPLAAGSCLSIAAAPTPHVQNRLPREGVSVSSLSGCQRHLDTVLKVLQLLLISESIRWLKRIKFVRPFQLKI